MTRNIRKVVSIVCAVALLLSLCVVSFTGAGQAFKLNDTPVGGTLKLTFDGNKGVSDTSDKNLCGYDVDPADPSNAVYRLRVNAIAANNLELGKDANVSAYNGDNAFTMQPDKQYVVSFKYKYAKGSYNKDNKIDIILYTGTKSLYDPAVSKNEIQRFSFIPNAENGTLNSDGAYVLNNDTEWMTAKATITTDSTVTRDNIYIVLANNQSAPFGKVTCYIDDVTVDTVDDDEGESTYNNKLVFNYRNDTTGEVWAPNNHSLLANSNKSLSYVDEAGLHFTGSHYQAVDSTDTWRHVCAVYDPDNGGYLQFKNKAMYAVTVKYKFETLGDQYAYLAIARSGSNGTASRKQNPASFGANTQHTLKPLVWSDKVTAPQSEWQYLTTIVDGSDESVTGSWLYLTMSSRNNAASKVLIESVTVSEVRNDEKGMAVINFETGSGNFEYPMTAVVGSPVSLPTPTTTATDVAFGGWYFDSALTKAVPADYTVVEGVTTLYARWAKDFVKVTFNNVGTISESTLASGAVLSRPERPNGKLFFEGWYTDLAFTNKVTEVPGDDCTLYAKYGYAYIGFNNGGMSTATNSKIEIIDDPDDASNKVLNLTTQNGASWNFELASYDAAGAPAYQLPKVNTKYFISFRVKVPAGNCGGSLSVYTGEQSTYSPDHSKGVISDLVYVWDDNAGEKGVDWVTVSGYYTVGENFYRERVNFSVQNQIYFVLDGRKGGKVNSGSPTIYIDDVLVGEVMTEAPEGAVGVYYRTNGSEVEPAFGYAGEAYVAPDTPTLTGHKFVGWYSDKALKKEFTSNVFPNETITLYAKWEMSDWTMNFDVYDNSGNFGRYTHKTDTDNPYLYYNFEQGTATSTSPATALARFFLNNGPKDYYETLDGITYTITFKYKVIEITGTGMFKPVLSNKKAAWTNSSEQGASITVSAPCDWTVGTIEFTAKQLKPTEPCNFLSLGVSGDATYMFDDITVSASADNSNVYGSVIYRLNTMGGGTLDPASGDPGDTIELPTPTRAGFKFGGWYVDETLTTKFTQTVYGEEGGVLYASWILGKFNEGFEDLPASIETQGVSSAYTIYKSTESGNDKSNVHGGTTSIFRKSDATGTKGFTLCRGVDLTLGVGSQYTVTFWVKPTKTGDPNGTINLISMSSNTSISAPDSTKTIKTVGELKEGEWQQITYTFTADQRYIGISTTAGNDIYFDDFTVTLNGYTGSSTGDSSVSPFIILMMVVVSAGALTVTGKKIFD